MRPKLVENNEIFKKFNYTNKKKINFNYIGIIIIVIFMCILHNRYNSKKSNNEDYILNPLFKSLL